MGCSPFIDARREAGQVQPVGQSSANRIAVCYNPLWDDETVRHQLATDACSHGHATAEETRYFNCCLFAPNTAFYTCK